MLGLRKQNSTVQSTWTQKRTSSKLHMTKIGNLSQKKSLQAEFRILEYLEPVGPPHVLCFLQILWPKSLTLKLRSLRASLSLTKGHIMRLAMKTCQFQQTTHSCAFLSALCTDRRVAHGGFSGLWCKEGCLNFSACLYKHQMLKLSQHGVLGFFLP